MNSKNLKLLSGENVPRYFWGAAIGAVGNIVSSAISNKKDKKAPVEKVETLTYNRPSTVDLMNNLTKYGGGLSNPTATTTGIGSNTMKGWDPSSKTSFFNGLRTDGTGIGGVMGTASAITDMATLQGNTSQKQMQRADSIVDGVSAAVSVIPGFGTAVGAGLQLVNRLGGAFVKQPSWMKNYKTNQNVMANSASFGGVASNAMDAEATASSYNRSGLAGKLVGRNRGTQNRFSIAQSQQDTTQGILDENTFARENMFAGADLINTRNLISQSGFANNWNRGGITFGKKGAKIKIKSRIENKEKKRPKTKMPNYFETTVKGGIKSCKFGALLISKPFKSKDLTSTLKEAISKHQFGGNLSVASTTGAKGGRPKNIKTTSSEVNKKDINTTTNSSAESKTYSTLDSQDRSTWNGFVDFVDSKGMKGSPTLDDRNQNISRGLWDEYSTSKGINKSYDEFIPTVQYNISEYRNRAIERMKSGEMNLSNFTREQLNAPDFDWNKNFMQGLSDIDGWAGSRTTSWKFPSETVKSKADPSKPLLINNKPVKNTTYQYRKDGGKVNVIVDGKLHARKHNLKEIEELSDASITHKGVPVIVKEDGGTINQAAEVEREELILHLELTKKIEELMKEGTEEAAIEAGKLLADELTFNIKDNAGVIEKLEEND